MKTDDDDRGIGEDVVKMLKLRSRTIGELVEEIGEPERRIRQVISNLRRDGYLIVNNGGHYTIARDAASVFRYTTSLRQRIRVHQAVIASMEAAAVKHFDLDSVVKVHETGL